MRILLYVILLSSYFTGLLASATELAWQQTLPEETIWSRLTFAGTLLVASENQLVHFDSSTGEVIWQRDDMHELAQFDVRDVRGAGHLVINERLSTRPKKSRLQLLDLGSGKSIWDSGELAGSVLGSYPVPRKNLLVAALSLQSDGETKSGVYLAAYALTDGEEIWRTRLGGKNSLPLHRSDASNMQDLSGHPRPVVTDDIFVLVAGDLLAVDLTSGEEAWRFDLNASVDNLKQTYAQPLLSDGILYAVGRSKLHAIDVASGVEQWQVKLGSAAIPQLEMRGQLILGRLGGTFSTGRELLRKSPFGAFVVDMNSRELAWKWTKARDSITNIELIPAQGLVMLADKKKLYALDLDATGNGKLVYEEDLEFKRKLGAADIAAKGISTVGGLLSGRVSLGGGDDRSDPPLDIEAYGDWLIVRAQYHVLAHNMAERKTAWSIEFAPPGLHPLALVAMGAVTAYMVADRASEDINSWRDVQRLDNALAMSSSFEAAAAARYAAAEKSRNLGFFLTQEE
ncbi:MAG: PQQ-like beta-propeller repeat protein, partial [Gammaproteobacteria bacterium]|nr:PQQ-like beta-propeller repeat protein [Gammaproteobacteria bacterium]